MSGWDFEEDRGGEANSGIWSDGFAFGVYQFLIVAAFLAALVLVIH